MKRFFEGFQQFFNPLSPAQRVMFVGMVFSIVVFLGGIFYWALQPDYALLFGSVDAESAQEIIAQLDEQGVQYKLEGDGRSIYVESDKVHELRLKLASEGMASSDVKGYELFDSNALGMTDFMQQVNNKRALEGELARSVNSLEQVDYSRVHLVLPERSPFQQTSEKASASVILTLKGGQRLKADQIDGITALIAGSVEGLDASSVTILDQNGNQLTNGLDSASEFASGNSQMQLRQKTEAYLTERGQTMLDRVLGVGNSILRVSVEHDFDKLVRESDLIDPDSRLIMSEEKKSDTQSDETLQQVPIDEFTPVDQRGETVVTSRRENESTTQSRNYEVNKTREVFEKTQGDIKRLTASVLLNYKQSVEVDEEGNEAITQEPYTPQEIQEFSEMVRLALGVNYRRGDELSISQVQFFDPTGNTPEVSFFDHPSAWNLILRWGLILMSFIAIVVLLFSIKKRISIPESQVTFGLPGGNINQAAFQPASPDNIPDVDDDEFEDFIDKKLSGKARKQLEQKAYVMEEIKDFVELKPSESAQVMKALMTNDE